MQRNRNFVYTLAESARKTVSEGYYRVEDAKLPHRSMREAIGSYKHTPLITEVKFKSPAEGELRAAQDVREIARKYERGGAVGISVLTEPKHFDGRIEYLTAVKKSVTLPVLMKDIIVDPVQVEAARRIGADIILLMAGVFRARLADQPLDSMVELAHSKGLEVLLEAHTEEEYRLALNSSADIVGINNRDLETLAVSLETSRRLLGLGKQGKLVISESGLSKRSELLELRTLGADGFLVGSTLMRSKDIEEAVRELAGA
jgi:indole-3-glycerol phosphate synthase